MLKNNILAFSDFSEELEASQGKCRSGPGLPEGFRGRVTCPMAKSPLGPRKSKGLIGQGQGIGSALSKKGKKHFPLLEGKGGQNPNAGQARDTTSSQKGDHGFGLGDFVDEMGDSLVH